MPMWPAMSSTPRWLSPNGMSSARPTFHVWPDAWLRPLFSTRATCIGAKSCPSSAYGITASGKPTRRINRLSQQGSSNRPTVANYDIPEATDGSGLVGPISVPDVASGVDRPWHPDLLVHLRAAADRRPARIWFCRNCKRLVAGDDRRRRAKRHGRTIRDSGGRHGADRHADLLECLHRPAMFFRAGGARCA